MLKKRWIILNLLVMVALLVAGCKAAPAVDEESQARIAELEAALAEAAQAGGVSEEAVADLQAELDSLKGDLGEAQAARCTFNAYRMGWVMDWADAGNMVDTVFGADSDFHYTFWQLSYPDKAEEFKALVKDAYRNTDPESRAAQWQEAEKMVVEDLVAVIPLFHYDRTTMVTADANPLFPPFGAPRFADWSFNTDQTEMRWSAGASVPTLDPQRSTDTTSSTVIYQMFDAPYKFDAEGLIQPLAATSYEVSDDGTVYTIHLREDAMWSDGAPVTAQHFVDGISRLLSPDMANDYAYVMFDIVGATDYNAGEVDTLDAVVALDDYTLQVTLNAALSYFDSILAFSTFHPIRLDVIEANPDDWLSPGNYVGNGAYMLVEHNPGENLVMEKNPNYWDADNVTIERLEAFMIAEPATSLAAFENGEIDWTAQGSFPPEDTPRLVDTPEFLLTPRPGVYYMGVNTTAEHTNNLTFRKALASAIDKRLILDSVAETPWRIDAWGVIPPEIFGYQGHNVGYGFDAAAAQGYLAEYMAEAGIEDAASITVELWYNKGGANQDVLEAVESMWEENLGITVETVNVEWATYLETLEECNVIGGGGF